jgi:hypothetical protein
MTREIDKEEVKKVLWEKGLLKWKLWAQQEVIYEKIRGLPQNIQTAVILCARQFGKSFLGTLLAVEDCIRTPGSSVLIVGPTIKQTTDIVHQSLRNLSNDSPEGLITRSKSESRWYIGSSELLIGGFDINNATRVRGRTLSNIYIEELVDSNPDTYLDSMRSDLAPALTHSKSGKMTYLTTLPKIPDHPFILETMTEAQANNAFYSYTIDDNRALTQDQYEACVRRCGGRESVEFRREYLNEIVRDPSIIIVPSYSEEKHLVDYKYPPEVFKQITVDFGGVRDKTVALLHTYIFQLNKHYVIDEKVWDSNTPTTVIFNDLKKWQKDHKIHRIYCDAPGQIIVDLNEEFDFPVMMPPKEDWQANVNNLEATFGLDEIRVNPSCKFLRLSLRSGTFNKNKTDFERTESLGHCDALACLMYALRVMDKTSPYFAFKNESKQTFDRITHLSEFQMQKVQGGTIATKRFGAFKK